MAPTVRLYFDGTILNGAVEKTSGTAVPLIWTEDDSQETSTTWTGTNDFGTATIVETQADPGVFTLGGQTFSTLADAKEAAQTDIDRTRRFNAWTEFFHTHEPPTAEV